MFQQFTYAGSYPNLIASKDFYNLSGSGDVKYQWTQDVMTYFRVGNAYKSGGFNPQNDLPGSPVVNSYKPEHVLSYELGIKSEWFNEHVRFNGDVYYTDYTGQQINAIGPACSALSVALPNCVINAGRSDYKGIEGSLTILPADGWEIDGTLGYIMPKYLEYELDHVNLANLVYFTDMPKTTLSGAAQYSFEPQPYGDLTIRADVSYASSKFSGPGPAVATSVSSAEPYLAYGAAQPFTNVGAEITLAHIPVNYDGVTVDAEVYGKNLIGTHEEFNVTDLTTAGLGWANGFFGVGRTFGVQLIGRF